MAKTILRSVGAWDKGAVNQREDVKTVQQLLKTIAGAGPSAYDPGKDDGLISRVPGASQTVKAIRAFQKTFMRVPDGVVSPNRETLRRLNEAADAATKGKAAVPAAPPPPPAPPPAAILGIHSNVAGGANDYTAGHAWLTITQNGVTAFYGLWPDAHPNVVDNGDKSDIRVGLEASQHAVASRYYKLSPAQTTQFWAQMHANVAWRYTNTCASWATEVVEAVVGEDLDADDYGGFETPRELGQSILDLERRDPTSIATPKTVAGNPASSSW